MDVMNKFSEFDKIARIVNKEARKLFTRNVQNAKWPACMH